MLSIEYWVFGVEEYKVDVRFREAGDQSYSRLPQGMAKSGSLSHNLVS